jgi:hypothetical protein
LPKPASLCFCLWSGGTYPNKVFFWFKLQGSI